MIPNHVTRTQAQPHRRAGHAHRRFVSFACTALALTSLSAPGASLPEPGTILYGKVLDRSGGGQSYQAVSGNLRYTLVDERDGSELTIETSLAAYPGGLSYRATIPHEAVAAGLTASSGAVPLDSSGSVFHIASVELDGAPARILPPSTSSITASQLQRAAAHRLDLEIALDLDDSDGDGIPDWWEELYGLDTSDRSDANSDTDSDGVNNLAEFLAGSNPAHPDISPSLDDTHLIVYPDKLSGVYFAAIDSDTPPASLVYTLVTPPATGTLSRRDANASPQPQNHSPLVAGDSFSGADLGAGRIVYQSAAGSATPAAFTVSVTDQTDGHLPAAADISLLPFEPEALPDAPDPAGALRDHLNTTTTSLETILWDLELLARPALIEPSPSAEGNPVITAHIFIGTTSSDHFHGSEGNDHFYAGYGDDVLTGGSGADTFGIVGASGRTGDDVITDFQPAEGDVIDLRFALTKSTPALASYVDITQVQGGWRLALDSDGDGSGFTDGSFTVTDDAPLPTPSSLWNSGSLLVPEGIFPETTLTLSSSASEASENGPTSASLTIQRSGDLSLPLSVPLNITGSATNGVDYASIPNVLTFAPSQSTATLTIEPFADQQAEATEIVEIEFLASSDYLLPDGERRFRFQISDLLPQLSLEIVESVAVNTPRRAATIVVHRSGALANSVLARLELGGTATPGDDFNAPPTLVNFTQGATTQTITIEPSATADLTTPKTVRLSLLPDAGYIVSGQTIGQVSLVDRLVSFESWRETHFPETAPEIPLDTFAATQLANGLTALQSYAFGLLPDSSVSSSFAPLRISHVGGTSVIVEYDRSPTTSALRFNLETTASPGSPWSPATPFIERLWTENTHAGRVQFRCDPTASPNRLFRLKVSRQ